VDNENKTTTQGLFGSEQRTTEEPLSIQGILAFL
jgi:hypothetical protein